ncbi:MAG: phosphoglycerate kinase [Luteibaculaceae bacterium]
MQTISQFNFSGKKAIIRVDFNVPLDEEFNITDDTRITAALPTINKILSDGGSVILMSHLGRPKGGPEDKFSLRHLVNHIAGLLDKPVKFAEDCIGSQAKELATSLKSGEVLLLENLRFYKEETAGDRAFAEKLASLADVYVNDAFGTAHRAHASTTIIADFFPQAKMPGFLMQSELDSVAKVMEHPQKPAVAIIGGAKVSSKITIIERLLDKIDRLVIGGGMTYTFVKAQGGEVGNSLVEDDYLETALHVIKKAKEKGVTIYLAQDSLCADSFSNDANTKVCPTNAIEKGYMGLDLGPEATKSLSEAVETSKTIMWNGPLGVFEFENFSHGTKAIAEAIANATQNGAFSLVGGGDSVAAVNQFGYNEKVSYVSTGGGALLELLEGIELPGVTALKK